MRKQGHDPLHQVEVVHETDSFEVTENGRYVKGHQTSSQERSVLEIEIVRLFLNEWPQVGKVDLLEHRHDQVLLCSALKRSEEDDSYGVESLNVCTVGI